jgi:(p)ppGpp synthase/HD superfamily hydrolase
MSIVSEALLFSTERHLHQFRKGTKVPYMVHLLNVCKILAERDCPDPLLAAALLHDVVEDTDTTIEEVEEKFGHEIAHLVRGATELDKLEKKDMDKKASWRSRKEHTINFITLEATRDQLLVIAADKLDNLRSIKDDLERLGPALWDRFNASSLEQAWYYQSLTEAFWKRKDTSDTLIKLTALIQSLVDDVFSVHN